MKKVTVEEIGRRLTNGVDTRFVDSRSQEAYDSAEMKLPQAVRVPAGEAEKHIADLGRDDYIVTYCT